MMKFSKQSATFFLLVFLLLAILAYFILKPFLSMVLGSIVIAFIFYPIYTWLKKRLKNENATALILTLLIFLIISVPFYFFLSSVTHEASNVYNLVREKYLNQDILKQECSIDTFLCRASSRVEGFLVDPRVQNYSTTALNKFISSFSTWATSFVFSLPKRLLDMFILFFLVFFFLRDGEFILSKLSSIMPLKTSHKKHIYKKLYGVTYAILYGQLLFAVIQGILGALGFYLLGLSNPLLWGTIIFFLALLPIVGAFLVWAPYGIYLLFMGYVSQDSSLTLKGILLLVYGFIFLSMMETTLKPKIVGSKAKVHPILILLGVLGGLTVFGIIGLVIGPIVLAILVTFVQLYQEEKSKG